MPVCLLADRAVVSVTGPDARTFLQNLITCDIDPLHAGEAAFGALLTPQGKILFDFLVVCATGLSFPTMAQPSRGNLDAASPLDSRSPVGAGVGNDTSNGDDVFLLDASADTAGALTKRLSMYKLRAKVVIEQRAAQVVAAWGGDDLPDGVRYRDPRHPDLGIRAIVDASAPSGSAADYEAHRIALGIPQGGADFGWGHAFPHEANMDLLHGVSFTKGCYVGQEVVSRMQHRGTTRRRIVTARFDGPAPAAGAEIRAGGVLIGTFGSSVQGHGLAAVRTDRLAEVPAGGVIDAGGTTLHLTNAP